MSSEIHQVSPEAMRVFVAFVALYLLIGSYMYFYMELPAIAYVLYGIVSWIVGMMLFYKLHKSSMADIKNT